MNTTIKLLTPIITLLFYLVLSPSCKKARDTQALLIGKWRVDSIQARRIINSQIVYETTIRPSGDYYDYKADNKLYRYWHTRYDTVPYNVTTLNGKSLIQYTYGQNPFSADTIIDLTSRHLTFKNPQGSDSKIFFTKY